MESVFWRAYGDACSRESGLELSIVHFGLFLKTHRDTEKEMPQSKSTPTLSNTEWNCIFEKNDIFHIFTCSNFFQWKETWSPVSVIY